MHTPHLPHLRAQHLRAIFYALSGFVCWVIADIFMKLAGMSPVPKYELISIGTISGMVSIFLFTCLKGERQELKAHRFDRLAGLGLLFGVVQFTNLFAVAQMPLANYYVIVFLSPVLLAIFGSLFLRERIHLAQGLAILAGFIGVLVAVNPMEIMSASDNVWMGYAAAGIGVFCFTMQILTIRVLGRSESRIAMAFYPRLGPFLVSIIAMSFFGVEKIPNEVLVYAIAMGAVGGIGWILIAHAYKLAPIGLIAPFQYSEIIFGAIAGYVIWGNIPSAHLTIGGTIIVASGLYILRHTHQSGRT